MLNRMSFSDFVEEFDVEETNRIKAEFKRLKSEHYLDHVGASLYGESQIKGIYENFEKNVYCNPHTSPLSEHAMNEVRTRILRHFNTSSSEYSVIFTSGATSSLKLVAETFSFSTEENSNKGAFYYCLHNHTSVLGMRAIVSTTNIEPVSKNILTDLPTENRLKFKNFTKNSLVTFSAQCNFNGIKVPLEIVEKIQHCGLSDDANFYVCLDASSFVSTNFLDLTKYRPDFVCLSFYKMFGYPTGLGALLVSKRGEKVLNKRYYGGGSVDIAIPSKENFHVKKKAVQERFEDGTPSFLSIVALNKSYEFLEKLIPSKGEKTFMVRISRHVFNLARYIFENLSKLRHFNGNPVIKFYHENAEEFVQSRQGGVLNFNVMRSDGSFVGFTEFGYLSNIHNITVRTGCFCNAGASQTNLNMNDQNLMSYFKMGRTCDGENLDLIEGKPTGSIRVSFGYMNCKENADYFIKFVRDCYVETTSYDTIGKNFGLVSYMTRTVITTRF